MLLITNYIAKYLNMLLSDYYII